MPVRTGPWQQKSREGSKPLRWGSQQNLECNWSAWWSPNRGKETRTQMVGMATSQNPLIWRGQYCRGQWKEQEGEEDWRRDGKITSKNERMGFGDSLMAAENREGWKGIVSTSSVVHRRPPRLRDWDEMRWNICSIAFCSKSVSVSLRSLGCTDQFHRPILGCMGLMNFETVFQATVPIYLQSFCIQLLHTWLKTE